MNDYALIIVSLISLYGLLVITQGYIKEKINLAHTRGYNDALRDVNADGKQFSASRRAKSRAKSKLAKRANQ